MGNRQGFFYFIILILFLFTGCDSSRTTKNDSTILEGNFQKQAGNKIYFYTYPDSLSLFLGIKKAIDSALIDNSGHFSFHLNTKISLIFDLNIKENILVSNLYLTPFTKTEINFEGVKNKPEITSPGIESKYNKFLLKFSNTFYSDSTMYHEYYIATNYMDLHQFTEYNNKRKQKQLDYFSNYFKNDSIDENFKEYALNTINYGIAVDRLMYLWKKRMKGENIFADSFYFLFETPSFIENKKAFNCPAYIRFLNLYIKDTYERMVERGELPPDKKVKLNPSVEKYNLTIKLLNKPCSDIVLYNIILNDKKGIGEGDLQDSKQTSSLDSLKAWFCRKYSIR